MRGRIAAVVAGAAVLATGTWLIMQGSGGPDGEADGLRVVALGEAEAVYREPFSVVSTVRELPGGRVLVADPLGQVVVRLDLGAGTADTIGSVGEGPSEYRQPDAVWPLPGGRTLLVDLGNGRLTELSPELEFGTTRPYSVGDMSMGQIVIALPQAVDHRGRLYFRGFGRMGMEADSASILRLDLDTDVVDSVASFDIPEVIRESVGGPGEQNERISQVPLSPGDAWGVAADGRVVIARAGEYRVDWVEEDGWITSGPPIPYTPIPLGRAEQEEWARGRLETGGGLGIAIEVENGSMTMRASRGGATDDDEDLDGYAWPEVKPPFYDRPIPVDGLGRAWVRRHRDAGEAPMYDVFGGSGERRMVVELPMDRRVVSFGDAVLYAVHMDEFGLQTLERYALP
ncbi:MAG: hypothetical protein F4X15_11030 [Gemmatimonadetes bacterium]|nr:hypothetical protein [Gemmatimonadota bacterium]MYC91993.1 hypothetical protein [Gemmatimonadota bacterium]